MSLLQPLFAFCLVLGLIGLLYIAVQKFNLGLPGSRANKQIRVTESISLGDKRNLVLVEVDGQRMLVGSTPQGISLLSTLAETRPSGVLESEGESASKSLFSQLLEGIR